MSRLGATYNALVQESRAPTSKNYNLLHLNMGANEGTITLPYNIPAGTIMTIKEVRIHMTSALTSANHNFIALDLDIINSNQVINGNENHHRIPLWNSWDTATSIYTTDIPLTVSDVVHRTINYKLYSGGSGTLLDFAADTKKVSVILSFEGKFSNTS